MTLEWIGHPHSCCAPNKHWRRSSKYTKLTTKQGVRNNTYVVRQKSLQKINNSIESKCYSFVWIEDKKSKHKNAFSAVVLNTIIKTFWCLRCFRSYRILKTFFHNIYLDSTQSSLTEVTNLFNCRLLITGSQRKHDRPSFLGDFFWRFKIQAI